MSKTTDEPYGYEPTVEARREQRIGILHAAGIGPISAKELAELLDDEALLDLAAWLLNRAA